MGLLGRLAHLFDGYRVEIGEKGFPARRTAGSITRSSSTEFAPRSSGSAVLERHRGAHDLAYGDAPALARQLVAASRPAHAFEDLGVDQALEQCLQVTGGQFVTRGQRFGGNRRRARV